MSIFKKSNLKPARNGAAGGGTPGSFADKFNASLNTSKRPFGTVTGLTTKSRALGRKK